MVGWISRRRYGPIGIDVGSTSVKLLQLSDDRATVVEAAYWELPPGSEGQPDRSPAAVTEAIQHAREGREFRGRETVMCLGAEDLFVQNIRVPQATGSELAKIVAAEAGGRLPFDSGEAEIRYLEADNVRQGDVVRREVILLACRRSAVEQIIGVAEQAGLVPIALDVEPAALLRCYAKQYRRDADQQRRVMYVNVGGSNTAVVIARGGDPMFVKYIDVGGRHLDAAVARHLKMELAEASALRRHHGDRRADQRDPEVSRGIVESVRPVLERLATELSMCVRYYSVTFRGQPLACTVLGGGEANAALAEWLTGRLDMNCELGEPLRAFEKPRVAGRGGQWGVAAGLALREVN
jgi:type IV pilus assembly protein PilM